MTKARIGYYKQDLQKYMFLDLDRPMEILTLIGNVSLKDGQPMVHAHVTLCDEAGRAFGGHLAAGAPVFACEFVIREVSRRRSSSAPSMRRPACFGPNQPVGAG